MSAPVHKSNTWCHARWGGLTRPICNRTSCWDLITDFLYIGPNASVKKYNSYSILLLPAVHYFLLCRMIYCCLFCTKQFRILDLSQPAGKNKENKATQSVFAVSGWKITQAIFRAFSVDFVFSFIFYHQYSTTSVSCDTVESSKN